MIFDVKFVFVATFEINVKIIVFSPNFNPNKKMLSTERRQKNV